MLRQRLILRKRKREKRFGFKLENDGRMRQVESLRNARVKLADEADAALAHKDRGGAARVETREDLCFKSGLKRRDEAFNVALHVVEVDHARRLAPLNVVGRTIREAGKMLRLTHALHRPRTVDNGRIREEHAAELEETDALGAAVEVVLQDVDESAQELRAHDRELARDRVEEADRLFNRAEGVLPGFGNKGKVDELLIAQMRHFAAKRMVRTAFFMLSLHGAALEGRTVGELVVAVESRHFLDQILFDFDVEAERRRHHGEDAVGVFVFKSKALEGRLHRFKRNFDADDAAAPLDAHLHRTARRKLRHDVRNGPRLRLGRSANVEHELRDVLEVIGRRREIHAALKPVGRVGREVQLAAAALNRLLREEGAFNEEIRRRIGDRRAIAAHDARKSFGAIPVANEDKGGIQVDRGAVQKRNLLARTSRAHRDLAALELVEVVEVRRPAELDHDVVRNVDQG